MQNRKCKPILTIADSRRTPCPRPFYETNAWYSSRWRIRPAADLGCRKHPMSSVDEDRMKGLLIGTSSVVVIVAIFAPSVILGDKVFNIVEQGNDPSDRSSLSHVVVRLPVRPVKTNSIHSKISLTFLWLHAPTQGPAASPPIARFCVSAGPVETLPPRLHLSLSVEGRPRVARPLGWCASHCSCCPAAR